MKRKSAQAPTSQARWSLWGGASLLAQAIGVGGCLSGAAFMALDFEGQERWLGWPGLRWVGQVAPLLPFWGWIAGAVFLGWACPQWGRAIAEACRRQGLRECSLALVVSVILFMTYVFGSGHRFPGLERCLPESMHKVLDQRWSGWMESAYHPWWVALGLALAFGVMTRTHFFQVHCMAWFRSMQEDWRALDFPKPLTTLQYTLVLGVVALILSCIISALDWLALKGLSKFIFPWVGTNE